jgi:hypothetical protein
MRVRSCRAERGIVAVRGDAECAREEGKRKGDGMDGLAGVDEAVLGVRASVVAREFRVIGIRCGSKPEMSSRGRKRARARKLATKRTSTTAGEQGQETYYRPPCGC